MLVYASFVDCCADIRWIWCVQLFARMQEVEALSRAGETVFTALRPYDLHDSIVSVVFIYYQPDWKMLSFLQLSAADLQWEAASLWKLWILPQIAELL